MSNTNKQSWRSRLKPTFLVWVNVLQKKFERKKIAHLNEKVNIPHKYNMHNEA